MTVCPRCGTLIVGRDQDKDEMRERIAALEGIIGKQEEELHQAELDKLEAENERLRQHQILLRDETVVLQLGTINRQASLWKDERQRAEQAEADLSALTSRRCGACQHDGVCAVQLAAWKQFGVMPFACACWMDVEK